MRCSYLKFAVLALLTAACGKDIGDPCSSNVDCANDGTRDCDRSQPGGYCTVNGCDEKSCPSEAVCIRIFPYSSRGLGCTQDSDCTSDHICLPEGFCVPRSTERRFCEKSCGGNGDCRGGYECRQAGLAGQLTSGTSPGSIALVANADQSTIIRFCAPLP